MRRYLSAACLALLILLCGTAAAQPDLSRKTGPTLADTGSAFYRFERFELASADGARHYRIWIGVPRRPPPATGYPVAYLLDGNAVMDALQEEWLAQLDRAGPPLLVAIGYATDLRFDVMARSYDYTPVASVAAPGGDTRDARPGGGAAAFLDLIEQHIKPRVAAENRLDTHRQTLWGHSYGGLLVLSALFGHPSHFQTYVAASPSLWWGNGAIIESARSFAGADAQLVLLRGGAEQRRNNDAAPDMPGAPETAETFTRRLQGVGGLRVVYREFAGLQHGPMFPASLRCALQLAAGDSDWEKVAP